MTNNQLDLIIGSLLGDGHLSKRGRAKNAMYKLKQSTKYASYVQYVYDALDEYVSCGVRSYKARKPSKVDGKICHLPEHWDGEYCEHNYFWTKADPVFTELWEKWYDHNVKHIPEDLTLNEVILSHWFVEDGSNNVTKDSKGIFLYTNSFTEEDCELLSKKLKDDMNITSKVYMCNGPVIRVVAGSYFDFMNIVSKHVKKFGHCFSHKIDTSKAPADRKGEKWTGAKLNLSIANEIREQSKTLTRKELASKYNISVSTVSKIVNNQMYKQDPCIAIGGSANVGLKY